MQKFSSIIFTYFLIQTTLSFMGPETECKVEQKLLNSFSQRYNMNFTADQFTCVVQTELNKVGKKTEMTKHFKMTHNGCEVKFNIKNGFSKSTADCTSNCLNNFNFCFTKQKNVVEKHQSKEKSSSIYVHTTSEESEAKLNQVEHESVEEDSYSHHFTTSEENNQE